MSRQRLSAEEIADLGGAGWGASEAVLEKSYAFESYADGVAFAVAVALAAERRDHHPDLAIGYRRVKVGWSTHDAGGTTRLDRDMALLTDATARRHGGEPSPS